MEILLGIKGQLYGNASSENIERRVNTLEKARWFTLQPYHLQRRGRAYWCSFNFQPLMGEKKLSSRRRPTFEWPGEKLQNFKRLFRSLSSKPHLGGRGGIALNTGAPFLTLSLTCRFENAIFWQCFIVCPNLRESPSLPSGPSWFSLNSLLWETKGSLWRKSPFRVSFLCVREAKISQPRLDLGFPNEQLNKAMQPVREKGRTGGSRNHEVDGVERWLSVTLMPTDSWTPAKSG